MTTLQEAARDALEALEHIQRCIGFGTATIHQGSATWCQSDDAIKSLKAALAQQGEQQPVAWYEYNQDLDAWFLAYGHNPKAKTRPLVFGDTAAPLAQQELPQKERPDFMAGYDAGMTDAKRMVQQGEPTDDQLVKGVKAMRLFVTKNSVADFKLGYMAALAAAPAQKPVAYITQTEQGPMVWTPEMYDEACTYCDDDEFPVPLYTAAPAPQAQDVPEVGFGNMQSAQPVAQPLAKTCDTCAHYQQGKHPGVSIYDETCYICREYYANKWEAKSE